MFLLLFLWAFLWRTLCLHTHIWTYEPCSRAVWTFRFSVPHCPWMQKDKWGLLSCWDVSPAPFQCKIHRLNKKGARWSLKCVNKVLLWSKIKIRVTEWEMTLIKHHCAFRFRSHQMIFMFCFLFFKFVWLAVCVLLFATQTKDYKMHALTCVRPWLWRVKTFLCVFSSLCEPSLNRERSLHWLDIMWKYFLLQATCSSWPIAAFKTVCHTAMTFEPKVKNVSKDH